jgi:hypothetical protein
VAHIDDRVQSRAQEIGLSAVLSAFGRIVPSDATTESRLAIRRNPEKMKLQAFEASNRKSLQSQKLPRPENRPLLNRFGGSSRPTH